MNAVQSSRFVGFKSVAGFGEKNAAEFLAMPQTTVSAKTRELFAELGRVADIEDPAAPGTVIGLLGRADKTQQSATGGNKEVILARGQLREKILTAMSEIRRGARSIGKGRGNSNLLANFRKPQNGTHRLLVTKALAYADAAEPLRAAFVELAFEPDFIETLRADVAAFESFKEEADGSRGDRAGAKAGINLQIERGMVILAQLDTIMRNKFKDRPQMLAAWLSISRMEKAGRAKTVPPVRPAPSTRALKAAAAKAAPVIPAEAPALSAAEEEQAPVIAEIPAPASLGNGSRRPRKEVRRRRTIAPAVLKEEAAPEEPKRSRRRRTGVAA